MNLFPYLKIIRPLNLIFLAAVQALMYFAVVQPILLIHGLPSGETGIPLFLLMVATVLVCAGGYVINDYFDVKIDRINRPDKVIITESISKSAAMRYYQALTLVGVLLGILLAFALRSVLLGVIFAAVAGLLWFYSASYKRQLLVGNLVVAFATALAVFVVALTQVAALEKHFGTLIYDTPSPLVPMLYVWVGGFAVFAFLCTLLRESIKDMEDHEGDCEAECRTLPVKWGIRRAKWVAYTLVAILAVLTLAAAHFIEFAGSVLTWRYAIFGVILPLVAETYLIATARGPKDFHYASSLMKAIMLSGTLYSVMFHFLAARTFGILFFNLFIVK